jgi:hypothetical protein
VADQWVIISLLQKSIRRGSSWGRVGLHLYR